MMNALREDMLKWRGRKWLGPDAHWCNDWDGLPVDALTPEYDCCCEPKTLLGIIANWFYMRYFNYFERKARRLEGDK